MNDPEANQQVRQLKRIVLWGVFAIVALWTGSGILLFPYQERGSFGDMFGAINALFSGFAFLGVIIAIFLQYQELKEQRLEIKQSRIAQQESAKALSSQLRMAEVRTRVESLNLLIEAQARILARLNERRTVAEDERRTLLQSRITQYEKELEQLLDEEIRKRDRGIL